MLLVCLIAGVGCALDDGPSGIDASGLDRGAFVDDGVDARLSLEGGHDNSAQDASAGDGGGTPDAMPWVMLDAMGDTGDDAMPDAMPDAIGHDSLDGSVSVVSDAAGLDDGGSDAAEPDAARDPTREHRCDDGLDDDGDGAVDCFDGDCLDDVPCNIVPETPVQFVQELFLQRCGCHTGALDFGGLRLVRPFTDTTVDIPAVLDPERILVVPGDVEASFLYLKLLDDIPAELGERMPPEIPYFDEAQLATVADWIRSLAPR